MEVAPPTTLFAPPDALLLACIAARCMPLILWSSLLPPRTVPFIVRAALGCLISIMVWLSIGQQNPLPVLTQPLTQPLTQAWLLIASEAARGILLLLLISAILHTARAAASLLATRLSPHHTHHDNTTDADHPLVRLLVLLLAASFWAGAGPTLLFAFVLRSFSTLPIAISPPAPALTTVADLFASALLLALPSLLVLAAAELLVVFGSRLIRRPHAADHAPAITHTLLPLLLLLAVAALLPSIVTFTLLNLARLLSTPVTISNLTGTPATPGTTELSTAWVPIGGT